MKAKVIRGVYIRGKAYPEGTVGGVGKQEAGDAFVVSHQEFNELVNANYLVHHAAPAVAPEAPVVAPESVAVTPEPAIEQSPKKGK